MTFPTPNDDESLVMPTNMPPLAAAPFIGNFHKTLPHNEYGEVDATAYRAFERTCQQIEAGMPLNFEQIPSGPTSGPDQTAFDPVAVSAGRATSAPFTSPMAGASTETLGPDPKTMEMIPAPGCQGLSAMAEMLELYWMALLRDAPLVALQQDRNPPQPGSANLAAHNVALDFQVTARVSDARQAVNAAFDCAIQRDQSPGRLRAPLDLQEGAGGATVNLQTLFRSGLRDEDKGPLLSQFFMQSIGYGTQTIDQRQVPYIARRDFLTKHDDWLLAQNTGKDRYGRAYGNCNNYADQQAGNLYYPTSDGLPAGEVIHRPISTMRDLARFVNRDALHQAYFNAALFLLGAGASPDAGNPYRGNRFGREHAFATLGGPDLLTLVSEVASRALKVVWRQKWLVHRRCRPEVVGGLIQMQRNGYARMGAPVARNYGLRLSATGCNAFDAAINDTLAEVSAHNAKQNNGAGTLFLPMAFSAGSPSHPAYGAGHATVAGACVTVLKAWFDEDERLVDLYARANSGPRQDPPAGQLRILQPGYRRELGTLEDFSDPQVYDRADAPLMTVGGELNKIASNVAMGRSMGGVHWRSDNTRSLRLGETVAIEILRKRTTEYAERPVSFTFRSFDRQTVHITQGEARVLA